MKQRSAFEIYLRTGRRVADPKTVETKFNPWHDPDDGRFTFSGQGRYFGHGRSTADRSAGLTNDELIIAAWWTQQGRSSVEKYVRRFLQDESEDVPHVNFGIAEAAKYVQFESPVATTISMPRSH